MPFQTPKSRLLLVLLGVALTLVFALPAYAQYTTDWIANTYGLDASYVGNAARSMWVAPEGVIYTSSLWDEDAGGVGIYQNGATIGSLGVHNEFQGSAITGNSVDLFALLPTTMHSAAADSSDVTTGPPRHAISSSPSAPTLPSRRAMSSPASPPPAACSI
jgi:hypothetical protein